MRIELTTSAWKAEVLPLNYTRILKVLSNLVTELQKLLYNLAFPIASVFCEILNKKYVISTHLYFLFICTEEFD